MVDLGLSWACIESDRSTPSVFRFDVDVPEALEVSSQKAAYLGTAQGGQAPLATSDSADSVRGTYVKIEFLGGVTM